jgi:hypothetical protein
MEPIQFAKQKLQRAAQSGDFAAAEIAARLYVAAIQAYLPQLPHSRSVSLLGEACQLVEWARRCLCLARVRLHEDSRRARRVAAYHRSAYPEAVYSWRIDG